VSKELRGFGQSLQLATLDQARAGKASAQRAIFERYQFAVIRTLIGLCHDTELARDLAQDVFIQAFAKVHQVRDHHAFGGWLKQLTIRTALAHFRRHKPTLELADNQQVNTDWSGMADWLIQLRDVETLINQLNDHDRMIVWLYLGEGFNHEEIASLTAEEPAAIRQRYHRALKKLHQFITKGADHEHSK